MNEVHNMQWAMSSFGISMNANQTGRAVRGVESSPALKRATNIAKRINRSLYSIDLAEKFDIKSNGTHK
jgi:tRNA U34 2-thiouridine synthase MnmA/TrmU